MYPKFTQKGHIWFQIWVTQFQYIKFRQNYFYENVSQPRVQNEEPWKNYQLYTRKETNCQADHDAIDRTGFFES